MCGIAGFIDWSKKTSILELKEMTNVLHHRGPDGGGEDLFKNEDYLIGFGHRRLAIIDVSDNANQPMSYKDYSIVFNGEIYNYKEVKTELVGLGHSFVTGSDTEMILHAYEQWGEECLHKFIGMFAIVILNQVEQNIFIARDRAGVKPLFYYLKGDLFLFASELKSFHKHSGFQKELDLQSVASFMQYGNVPSSECIFKNTHKLKPGNFLSIDLKNKKFKSKEYWNVYDHYNKPKSTLSFEEAKIETEKIITSAVNYRMIADVPVGVFLSGGYDSATVTTLLQKDRTEKIKTFTIGVPDIGLNEAPFAKDVANFLGTDHTELYFTQREAIDLIPDLSFYYDEPFADSSALPTTLVSKMARESVTVALSADAGDEVFAGYNRYDYLERFGNKIQSLPKFARNFAYTGMNMLPSDKIPFFKHKYNFHNRYEKLKQLLRDPSSERIMLSLSQQFSDSQIQNLFLFDVLKRENAYTSKELKDQFYSPLSYMMAIDYQTYLVDDILQKVDRATMTLSLEGREPLLDHRILEWAATLPNKYKYYQGQKKYILKEIVHQYIPKELMSRPKMGFAIPIADWMQNELKDFVETYINETVIVSQGIFNWNYVKKIKDDFYSGKKEFDVKLWYLLMFQTWYDRWMR